MKLPKQRRGQGGFTIVELIIATLVFSTVLLVAMSGFIEIGRLFYKGANATANQQAARDITAAVKADIATTSNISTVKKVTANGGNIRYYCVGNSRYTFIPGNQVKLNDHDHINKFGLLSDTLPGVGGCANPFDPPGSVPIPDNASELLGDRMRLNYFCITPNTQVSYGSLYDISISVVSGADNYLSPGGTGGSDCQAAQLLDCNSALKTSQYCARTDLNTSVAAFNPNVNIGATE